MLKSAMKAEKEVKEEMDEVTPYRYTVSSYGADYTVDSLVKRINAGDIYIPPFQRSFVWTYAQASRFIESLLLGLPVPGIFLSKEFETGKHIVIDGQQRLRTLQFFYNGLFGEKKEGEKRKLKTFALKQVQEEFDGLTYETLKVEDRRRLDDSIIHTTIVRQEKPEADSSSIFYVFERLNTGGTYLQPQEIRACIYQGRFDELLEQLNQYPTWRTIYGSKKPSNRLRDQELILRFFALYYNWDTYVEPMKTFLNLFMNRNRKLTIHNKETLTNLFTNTIDAASRFENSKAFRLEKVLLASLFDAGMVGLAKRLERGPITDFEAAYDQYLNLVSDPDYNKLLTRATANEKNVKERISRMIKALKDVP